MFVKIREHAERREHAKPQVQYQHSAATRLSVKQQKYKAVTILIAHPATLSARYAVCSVQIRSGDLAGATCSSHLDLYLPALQVQVVCT